jgi:hypothetical protein
VALGPEWVDDAALDPPPEGAHIYGLKKSIDVHRGTPNRRSAQEPARKSQARSPRHRRWEIGQQRT